MSTPRADVILALVDAARAGMVPLAEDATADEVYSACLSLALSAIVSCMAMGANPVQLRQSVEVLLMHCAEPVPAERMN